MTDSWRQNLLALHQCWVALPRLLNQNWGGTCACCPLPPSRFPRLCYEPGVGSLGPHFLSWFSGILYATMHQNGAQPLPQHLPCREGNPSPHPTHRRPHRLNPQPSAHRTSISSCFWRPGSTAGISTHRFAQNCTQKSFNESNIKRHCYCNGYLTNWLTIAIIFIIHYCRPSACDNWRYVHSAT